VRLLLILLELVIGRSSRDVVSMLFEDSDFGFLRSHAAGVQGPAGGGLAEEGGEGAGGRGEGVHAIGPRDRATVRDVLPKVIQGAAEAAALSEA
jgi:hypothetical protein